MRKINVFIIDDSAVVREILTARLGQYDHIRIVGSAIDPYIAREKIAKLDIDVITLDIELPRMDGLTFLKYLMKYYPVPTIILSSLADKRNEASMKALELGAVDIVPKPGGPYSVTDVIGSLAEKIDAAAYIDFEKVKHLAGRNAAEPVNGQAAMLSTISTTKKMIAIGASTGGTNALEMLIKKFHSNMPPCVITIHMPEHFTRTFADRLNQLGNVRVSEAADNVKAEYGHVYIAPGNYHLVVKSSGADHILKIIKGPYVYHQRPSVDVMFKSVAESAGKNCIGVLLTGMGKDGARGLLDIRNSGGYTIAQDEATSIVFGMPKEAITLGAVCSVLPIDRIAGDVIKHIESTC